VKGAVPADCPAHMMLCCCDPFPGQEFAISPSSPLNWYLQPEDYKLKTHQNIQVQDGH